MKNLTLKQNANKILIWFIVLRILHIVLFTVSSMISGGLEVIKGVTGIASLFSPLLTVFFIIIFMIYRTKLLKLAKIIDNDLDKKNIESYETYIKWFPFISMLLFLTTCTFGGIFAALLAYKFDIIFSFVQVLFFFLLGSAQGLVFASIFYYKIKTLLYPLTSYMEFRPLSLVEKFGIPILATIILLFSISSSFLYKIRYGGVFSNYNKIISLESKMVVNNIDFNFSKILVKIVGVSHYPDIELMDIKKNKVLLASLDKKQDDELFGEFFIINKDGKAFNGKGESSDFSQFKFFQDLIKNGKKGVSKKMKNPFNNSKGIICIAPIKNNGKVVGAIGSMIDTSLLKKKMRGSELHNSENLLTTNSNGKILDYSDKSYKFKVIGKDLSSRDKNFEYIERILTVPEKELFYFVFNGVKKYGYKRVIKTTGNYLIYTVDMTDFFKGLSSVLIKTILALILGTFLISFTIYLTAIKFSKPIQETIVIFKKLASGNMELEKVEILRDEFGELIRAFRLFHHRLVEILRISSISSMELADASSKLASTSSILSDNAQTQAASVEEASASIEEIASSLELIADNAKQQSGFATETYNSMKNLGDDSTIITNYAKEALEISTQSTSEASRGSDLMQNAIESMDKIDLSTKKIAEIVVMISDISEQVNLLSLNAAIEAARAGEQGKGFAVVADEISKLADQTASSTKSITTLIQSGLMEVGQGRDNVDATSQTLMNIINYIAKTEELVSLISDSSVKQDKSTVVTLENTKQVTEMAESISMSTSEQMMTNQEMTKTIDVINENTQSVAGGAEDIAAAAEEISAQAESLKEQMSFFKLED